MAAPTMTMNQTGLASQSLAASANVTFNVDATAKFSLQMQIKNTGGGTVAATNGVRVQVFRNTGTTGSPVWDTVVLQQFTITTTVSVSSFQSIELPTGHYQFSMTNLDATNAVTVSGIYATVDAIV